MIALSNRIHESFRLFFSIALIMITKYTLIDTQIERNERVKENTGLRVTQREN